MTMNSPNKEYRKCVLAFLDILGFKNIVASVGTSSERAMQFVHSLDRIINSCIDNCIECQKQQIDALNIQYSIFSDSICLWCFIDEDEHFSQNGKYSYEYISKCYSATLTLCQIIANIQIRGLSEGIIFRGAISIGQHYCCNNVTFSNALVKAYIAESTFSTYPRVILFSFDDDCILTALLDSLLHTGYVTEEDWVYIDYLRVLYPTLRFQYDLIAADLELHKNLIIKGLCDNSDDPRVLEKYNWLAKYHNSRLMNGYEDKQIFLES